MKKEQLYEVLGDIDENYIANARKIQKKKSIVTRSAFLKWGGMAACLCLMIVAVFVANPFRGPEKVEGPYSYTVAYVGLSDGQNIIYDGATNKDLLQREPGKHLPVFRIDALEDLEQFKSKYETILDMNQSIDGSLSFEESLKKAQWDREIFYEDHSMLIIYVSANSDSLRFYIEKIMEDENALTLYVGQKDYPEICTDGMAGWVLFVGVEKEELQKYTSIDALYYAIN